MYNHIIYNIEDKFPVDKEFNTIYTNRVRQGRDFLANKKVLALSIIRNISNEYRYTLKVLKDLLSYCHTDSHVCIYENDSIDLTPNLVQEHIVKYDGYQNFHIVSESLNTPYLPLSKSKVRTENLANARNKCLAFGHSILPNPDFYLVIDLDFLNLSIHGILNSFGWLGLNPSISGICGNSYIDFSSSNREVFQNYDSFAFRLNYWDYREPIWFAYFNLPIGSPPIPVNSGFGGSCIYRYGYYGGLYGGEDCEHVVLHKNLKEKLQNFSLYYNPSQIMILK